MRPAPPTVVALVPRAVAVVTALVAGALLPGAARADEPTRWEELFFPFPIVGAPPQLESQAQLFVSAFHGARGDGVGTAAELALIATPHLGFVATLPYQIGASGELPSGRGDLVLQAQYLAAGSLRHDAMVSLGLELSLPTAQHDLGSGDLLFGPFVFAAQRFWHRLVVEVDATALVPTLHGETARQFPLAALLSVLVTPLRLPVPIYLQGELDATLYTVGPAVVQAAPELFIGPVGGVRFAAGLFFALHGDATYRRTATLTIAFDLPNRFGY